MRVQTKQGGDERAILTAMVVDRTVLARIAGQWPQMGGLFTSKYANILGGMCVKYFNKYNKAPGPNIERVYGNWANNGQRDVGTASLVEQLLAAIDGEYRSAKRATNSQFILDTAGTHFNKVRHERLINDLQQDYDNGATEEAEKRLTNWGRVELGAGAGVDLMGDAEAWTTAFAEGQEALVTYPGKLGEFFGNSLQRDAFIAFTAPEKRGKCVSGDAVVTLTDGRQKTIRELVKQGRHEVILALDEDTQRVVPCKIARLWDNGKKPCYKTTTKTGRAVSTTVNHKFLTPTGWKLLEEIKVGDFIAAPKIIDYFGDERLADGLVEFLSYMLAEGGCTGDSGVFTNHDDTLNEGFVQCCNTLGIRTSINGYRVGLRGANPLLREYGLFGVLSKHKKIPDAIFKCPKEQIATFLRIFFSCDGCILKQNTKPEIELTLASEVMLKQISHLLNRFGVVHKVYYCPSKLNGKVFDAWRMLVRSNEYVALFLSEIGLLSYKKTPPPTVTTKRSFLDRLPYEVVTSFCKELAQSTKDPPKVATKGKGNHQRPGCGYRIFVAPKHEHIKEQLRLKRPMMRQSFAHLDQKHPTVNKYMGSHILWDEVVSIEYEGVVDTYDIAIPKHHNFIANDVFVHNSFWLMDLAWRAMCQRRRTALFEVGDMSQAQLMARWGTRAAKTPTNSGKVKVPISISKATDDQFAKVIFREKKFINGLTWQKAYKACQQVMDSKVRSKDCYLKMSCHPNSSINLSGIRAILDGWVRDGWVPDVIVIDYADILAPPAGVQDTRDQINMTWKGLRRLSQEFHCLLVTATQADANSYGAYTIRKKNFSEDKRKHAHCTGMIGINQMEEEEDEGIMRLNWVDRRNAAYRERHCIHVAGCLALAQPAMFSCY